MSQMKIIDAHCHYGFSESWEAKAREKEYWLLSKEYNCQFIPAIMRPSNHRDWVTRSKELISAIQKRPDLFVGMTVWLNSEEPEKSIEFVKEMPKGVAKILKIIPDKPKMCSLPILHPNNRKLFEFAADIKLPMFIHCTKTVPNHPEQVAQVAGDYPDLQVIFGHMGGTRPELNRIARKFAKRLDNLWFDTSGLLFDILEPTVRELGADRVLFGSDFPVLIFPGQYYAIFKSNLSIEDKKKILHDNVLRLLKC